MENNVEEKPLTFSQLVQFYREVMRPEMEQSTRSQRTQLYQEVMRPEMEQSTRSQMTQFYQEVMRPEMEQSARSQMAEFHHEVARPEMEQSNFSQLVRFYHDVMRPETEQLIDEKLEARLNPLRDEMLQGFDDLYKKFETLDIEYQAITYGLRRLEGDVSVLKSDVAKIKRVLSQ